MLPALFIFLGFVILFVFVRDFSIGLVLSGLLGIAWYFVEQYKMLALKVKGLERQLSELMTVNTSAVDQDDVSKPIVEDTKPIEPEEIKPSVSSAASTLPQTNDPLIEVLPEIKPEIGAEDEYGLVDMPRSAAQRPVVPSTPKQPSMIEKLARKAIAGAWQWVTDGNVFVRVGIIILFMGMTFLIRYAIGENLIPIEVRLAAVGSAAIGLLFWGWCQRTKRASFALVVQGGGIGLLYLTIFAGFSLYDVIPSGFAFILLAITVVLAAMLSVYQDAKALALFATIGGFLAPILTSSGSNNYIGLFSYYTLLNIGVFALAWSKSWRVLNFIGFLFTFTVSSIWGASSYQAKNFATVEPFLIIFFLLYVAIGVLYALKRAPSFTDYVDSSLIFGTPLLAFGLQSVMVGHFEYGIAISAVCLAVFYLVLANVLWNKYGERLRLLSETFLSLGVIFATLAIPFAIDGTLTGATWAIEGLGILWVSIRQQQKYRRMFGVMLIVAASIMLAYELWATSYSATALSTYAFANTAFIGSCIIAIAASIASVLLSQHFAGRRSFEARIANGLLLYSLWLLLCGFEYQIYTFDLFSMHGNLLALLSLCCVMVYSWSAKRYQWQQGHWVSVGAIVVLMVAALLTYAYQSQLALHYGYIVWSLALLVYFYGLKQAQNIVEKKWFFIAHILISILLVSLLLWEGLWQLLLGYSLLSIVFHQLGHRLSWPQLKVCALGFLPVLIICSVGAVIVDGNLAMLSSIASSIHWPFPSGFVLWPFAFSVYFYLLYQNQSVAGKYTGYLHYAGALLIGLLLLWLGLWTLLLGASLLCGLCCYLWTKFDWKDMHTLSVALLPVMLLIAGVKLLDNNFDPFVLQGFNVDIAWPIEAGYLLWPLAFIILFWSYCQYDKNNEKGTAISLPS